ncbi:MAG: aminotransferase class I/II-fold pyridoxal phosphate-dependent enzyme [Parcubacteria group bacterium]|nr:aminotransferase class I/II-fold pyridoxal phosphate-dependent enzyme [Parcubacteria group bacterium]
MEKKRIGFEKETIAVRGLWRPNEKERSLIPPIQESTAFWFKNSLEAERLFASEEEGLIYGPITNDSVSYFEEKMAALEEAEAGLATSTGMAAISLLTKYLVKEGDEIVSSKKVYGGTFHLFSEFLPKQGIKANFVEDPNNPGEWLARINYKTKFLFIETPTNPNSDLVDFLLLKNIAKIGQKYRRIPLIVDSTLATPMLLNPIQYGADFVIHSATKYISGNGSAFGGIILGKKYHIDELRRGIFRETRPSMTPENAAKLNKSLETLPLRMKAHCQNALKIASHLKNHPKVERVNFSGFSDSPYYDLAQKQMKNGVGALFSFDVKGEEEQARKFLDSLELIYQAANLGDARTLAIHPATTTHQYVDEESKKNLGILETTVRLSIGLESWIDIINDINQALDKI